MLKRAEIWRGKALAALLCLRSSSETPQFLGRACDGVAQRSAIFGASWRAATFSAAAGDRIAGMIVKFVKPALKPAKARSICIIGDVNALYQKEGIVAMVNGMADDNIARVW